MARRRRKNPDDTTKVILIGGAVAIGAYFLFIHKKKSELTMAPLVIPPKFVVKNDPGGGRQCFTRDGEKAPLVNCEGLGSLGSLGMGSLGE
jgi:hypothetical protein